MKIKILPLIVLISAALASVFPAGAKQPTIRQPITDWQLDFANDSCAMRRAFGTGEQPILLELRRFAVGSAIQITIAASKLKITKQPFKYRFGPADKFREPRNWNYARFAGDRQGVVFTGTLPAPGPEEPVVGETEDSDEMTPADVREFEAKLIAAGANAPALTISKAFSGGDLTLQTGPLDDALREIAGCFDDLLRGWNLDVSAHHSLTRYARPINVEMVAKMMQYPPKMLAKGLEGIVSVRLMIDKRGEVTSCFIQNPISDPLFDKSTCGDLQHELQFEPALDANGQAIDSYWRTQVYYRIPS